MIKRLLRNTHIALLREYLQHVPFLCRVKDALFPHPGVDYAEIEAARKVVLDFPDNATKPRVGVVKDKQGRHRNDRYVYWVRFERFLKNNAVPHGFIDIQCSRWVEEAKEYDIILWKPDTSPAALEEIRTKIYFLENYLAKQCFPAYRDIWHYEDKVRQYYLLRHFGFPHIETFVTHDRAEALAYVEQAEYPLVSEIVASTHSCGVTLLPHKAAARRAVKKIFGSGYRTHWTYARQKDYCLFQKFVPHVYDVRVVAVGSSYFGYYRRVPEGDFRASGMGQEERRAIPLELVDIARKVQDCLQTAMVAVDFLEAAEGTFPISEISTFVRFIDSHDLHVNGEPGRLLYKQGKYQFEKGRFWPQEIALAAIVQEWLSYDEAGGGES